MTTGSRIISLWTLPLFSICLFQLYQVSSGRETALFPYGLKNNDTLLQHNVNEDVVKLTHPIRFAGYEYKELHLATQGYVGFVKSVFSFDNMKESGSKTPFLAPLYFDAFYAGESARDKDGIYYRMLTSESELLKNLTTIVQESVVGANGFTADEAFVATWCHVRDKIHRTEINDNTTNTFQLVIVFNKEETYAIFNYDRVHPIKKQVYYAGISAGFYKGWTHVMPGTKPAENLSQLPFMDTGNQEGRFVFRVTKEKPERGGCSSLQHDLSVYPKSAGMFGGRMLEVSAPCLHSNLTALECRFHNKGGTHNHSPAIMINHMKARCVVPRLKFRGDISLEFSTDDGKTVAANTSFHIVLPSLMPTEVDTSKSQGLSAWDQKYAEELAITWESNLLTTDKNASVDVNLVGYLETRQHLTYKRLAKLGSDIRNSDQRFSFKPKRHQCSGENCQFHVGMIEVKLRDPSLANTSLFLNTKILPLGWFVSNNLERNLGRDWSNIKCEEMKNDRDHHSHWLDHLSICPCTLDQAIADFGRWIPAADCNIHHLQTCSYHETAVHCVRSTESTPSSSGNQCCYRSDGSLMYSSDTKHGSTPDKAAAFGKYPFEKINHVPELSHWAWDVIPYYYCCLWGSHCNTYMVERPTVNCKDYQLPTTFTIFGDPHIITSYGFGYTMQAVGTYWLLRSTPGCKGHLHLQGTFIDSLVSASGKKVSQLNAISLKNSEGDIIEVRMRKPYDFDVRLDVLVNGKYIRFDREHGYIHVFENMAIFDNLQNGRHQNFTIITDRGIGIKIFEEHGTMPVILTIPPVFKGKVEGLLGIWYETKATGLSFKNKTIVDIEDEAAMQEYINQWEVEAAASSFHHYLPRDQTFKPDNIKGQNIPHDYQKVCGNGQYKDLCIYDYKATENKDVASVAKETIDLYKFFSDRQKHADNCGRLEVKYGVFDHANYSLGNTIHVLKCHQGYVLNGHSEYKCVKDEGSFHWHPHVDSKCVSRHDEISDVGLIVGILVGSVALIFIITVIVCCIRNKAKSGKKHDGKVKDPAEADTMITMKDTQAV